MTIGSTNNMCKISGEDYSIGEKYDANLPPCTICTCSKDEKKSCENITNCQQIDCKRNSLFHIRCCQKLKCSSIFFIIRNIK